MNRNKAVVLVSGGIDSPAAAAIMSKKFEIIPLHFGLYPFYCAGSVKKIIHILRKLKMATKYKYAIVFPWSYTLRHIMQKIPDKRYQCILCRKAMYVAAELVAQKENAQIIVTGEALGQKASQTLQNIRATTHIKMPIIRPLIGYNKKEIEMVAKSANVWTLKHVGCCGATPKYPATHAKPEIAEQYFEQLRLYKILSEEMNRSVYITTDNIEREFEEIIKQGIQHARV